MKENVAWITVVVASITAVAGLAGSFVGAYLQSRAALKAARHQASAAAAADRSERYASWQMHKREVYSNLLQAIQEAPDDPNGNLSQAFGESLSRALMVANKELRPHLVRLPADASRFQETSYRLDLIERLVEDVQRVGVSS